MRVNPLLLALLIAAPASVARAQCPDGSPPPCGRRARIDTNVFVVVPFTVRGPPNLQYLGEAMVDLLHMALDGVGRMRVEYAPGTLRRLNDLPARDDPRGAVGVALELGAGRLIGGTIVALGNEVSIRAEVFDAQRERVQFAVEQRAPLADVDAAANSLASAILARRLVPASERQKLGGGLATRSPAALSAYLVARQLSLRAQRHAAAESLKVALRHDSSYAPAIALLLRIEGAQGGVTGLSGQKLDELRRVFRANRERYDDRMRRAVDIGEAYELGDRARVLAIVDDYAARYPGDAEAAFQRADKYFHFGLNMGEPRERVLAMFDDALKFDDQDLELLNHLPVLYDEIGDTATANRLEKRCTDAAACPGPDPGYHALVLGEDPIRLATGRDSMFLPHSAHYLLRGIASLRPAWGLAVTDSFAAIQTAPNRPAQHRANAYLLRSNVALARGQYRLAWAFLDSNRALGRFQPIGYLLLNEVVAGTPNPLPASLVNRNATPQVLALAWRSALRDSPDSAEAVFRDIEKLPTPDSIVGRATATGLRGIVALRLGDTVGARDLLLRARSNHKRRATPSRMVYPGAWLALKLAEVEAARGDFASARLHLADVYPINDYVPFIGDAEELRARVSLALGDTTAAKASLRIVVDLWDKADPVLQPRVAAARALLARLEGQ